MSAGTAKAKEKKLPAPLTPEQEAELEAIKPTDRFAAVGGWSPTPNLLLDHHEKVSGHVQSILVQHIIRFTFGLERGAHEYALIKFSELEKKTRYTRKAFQLALDEAAERRLIRRKKEGKHWLCKIVPEDWKSVKPYTWNHNPAGTPTVRDAAGRFTLGTEPLPILDELLKGIDPKTASIRSVIETADPVSVALEVATDGVVSVVVRDAGPSIPKGSILQKHRSDYTTVRPFFALFRLVLDPIFKKLFRKVPDEALLAQIVELCDGAPPEMLAVRVNEKVRKGAYKESGLVIHLARDVGEAWRNEATERAATEADEAEQQEAADRRRERILAALCVECEGKGCSDCDDRGVRPGVCCFCFGDGCSDCKGTGSSDS